MIVKKINFKTILILLIVVFLLGSASLNIVCADDIWADKEITLISDSKGKNPLVAVDSDLTSHVFWISENSKSIEYGYKTQCSDWSLIEKIYTSSIYASSGNYISYLFACLDGEDTIHVVWSEYPFMDSSENEAFIYYMYKIKGNAWSDVDLIYESNVRETIELSMVKDSEDNLYIVWSSQNPQNPQDIAGEYYPDIFFDYKLKDESWVTLEIIAESTMNSLNPSLAIDSDDTLHLVYGEHGGQGIIAFHGEIHYRYKLKDEAWSGSTELASNSFSPKIAIDETDKVHVVYVDYNYPGDDIAYRSKPKDGSWSSSEFIYQTDTNAGSCIIDVSPDRTIHVVFKDSDLLYSSKTQNENWKNPEVISESSYLYSLVSDLDNNLYIVWDQERYIHYMTTKENLPPDSPSAQVKGSIPEYTETAYTFTTTATDPEGCNNIYYWFDWGDDTNSGWIGAFSSGEEIETSHSWTELGTFEVLVKVKDNKDLESDWSNPLFVNISKLNYHPNIPNVTSDSMAGFVDTNFTFIMSSIDDNEDDVYFWIDWGDGTNSGWLGPYNSGEELTLIHTWDQTGDYSIGVKAKDIRNTESEWSEEIIITISQKTPGFELFIAIFALALVVFFWKQKRTD